MLVTSREGLFVTGEQIFRLPPLLWAMALGLGCLAATAWLTYRLGGGRVKVHLKVDMDNSVKPNYVVEARLRNRPVQEMYRKMIASEVRRTSDQWNPLKIAFDRPHEADFPEALMKLSWRERGLVMRDMWRFIVLYKEFKWGRQIARAAYDRLRTAGYPERRWL